MSVRVFEEFYPRFGIPRDVYLTSYDNDWICYYSRLLQAEGFEVTWYVFSREVAAVEVQRHAPTGACVRFIPASPLYNWWTARLPRIRRFTLHLATLSAPFFRELRDNPPDVLYVQDYESGRFDVASVAAARLGLPVIGQFHGGHSPALWPLGWLRRWAIRRAAYILSPSVPEHQRVRSIYGLPPERAQCFPNPVAMFERPADTGEIRRELSMRSGDRYVLFLGRVDANKGVDLAVKAYRRLVDRFADLHLVVAGDGAALPEIREAAADLPNVHFLGWVARRERVHELLGAADVVVLPSEHEAFGYAVAEAMVAGRPVVATAVGGLNDLVVHGVTGLLVEQRDERHIADALATVLADPERAAEMGRAGRARVMAEFSDTVLVPRLATILRTAAAVRELRGARRHPHETAADPR